MKSIIVILLFLVINHVNAQEWTKVHQYVANWQTDADINGIQFIEANVGYFSVSHYFNGSTVGDADLYMTNNAGLDWGKIYTLQGKTFGSAKIYFDFLDTRNFFLYNSYDGSLNHGKLFRDSVESSIGFTPYPPPYIKNISMDTVILSNFDDENYIYMINPPQMDLEKLPISDSYLYLYPPWYTDYDIINSVSFISGYGTAIGNRNGVNYFYSSNGTYDVWTKATLDLSGTLNKVYFMNKNIGFIISNDTTLHKTENGGQDWVEITLPSSIEIKDIQFGDTKGYLIGNNGKVFSSTDEGISWIIETLETTSSIEYLSVVNDIAYIVDSDNQIFTNNPNLPVDIEVHEIERFNIYPNPAHSVINIVSDKEIKDVVLYNSQGQIVLKYDNIKHTKFQIDVGRLIPGIYLIKTSSDSESGTSKIVKN